MALAVAGYAVSPIDLIPDFVPVLGLLDDIIIVPLGIALVVRLVPPEIMAEHRELASAAEDRPVSDRAAAVVVALWAGRCRLRNVDSLAPAQSVVPVLQSRTSPLTCLEELN